MSEIFDRIYDQMDLREVMFRLPSEMAINAIKRRIKTADELPTMFAIQDKLSVKVPSLKSHINDLISGVEVEDLLEKIPVENHPHLFSWLDNKNSKRILESGNEKLTIELVFNLTDAKDIGGMTKVLERILKDTEPKLSKVSSVLRKIDSQYFLQLVDLVLRDQRDYIRTAVLAIPDGNYKLLSETQKMIAVKALAKVPASCESPKAIQKIDFKLFQNLKPLERIMALDKYLDYFSKYKKIKVFDPAPTEDELNAILWAGCFEYNDLVEEIKTKYMDITENEKPKDTE